MFSIAAEQKKNSNGWNSYEKRIANHDAHRVHANNSHSPDLPPPSQNYEPITKAIQTIYPFRESSLSSVHLV